MSSAVPQAFYPVRTKIEKSCHDGLASNGTNIFFTDNKVSGFTHILIFTSFDLVCPQIVC